MPAPPQPALLSSDEIRLLTEIGFIAAASGDIVRASRIFDALVMLRPHRAFPYIGKALAGMNAGKLQEAVMVFERAPTVEADDRADMALYHALALQLASRAGESQRVLARIDLATATPEAARMVCSMSGRAHEPL
jgi:tetratricopeptide (TPR) repeat protein